MVKYLCEAYTLGGPVAIMMSKDALLWDGMRDYLPATKLHGDGLLVPFETKFGAHGFLFNQEVDGNFHVFSGDNRFIVVSEHYLPEGLKLQHIELDYENSLCADSDRILFKFGGKILIFDAVLSADEIYSMLNKSGEFVFYDSDTLLPNAALVNIPSGTWKSQNFVYDSDGMFYEGVVFKLIENS